ncbi:MAG: hypothetical protein V3U64_06960 [Cocleimonas sp.]
MPTKTLFSIIESPTHPFLTPLYNKLGIDELCFKHMRKLIAKVKKEQPDYIAAEFFYGYGNNYAGINISNLDVMLYSLQRYSPDTRVIVFVDKKDRQYVDKLNNILPLHAVLTLPLNQAELIMSLKTTLNNPKM